MTSDQPAKTVTLLYDGWQVWDGQLGPVRMGADVVASVEFVQRSALRPVASGTPPGLEHLGDARYLATAEVLDTVGAVVLDLGVLRAVRWVRPGEDPGDFTAGTTVSLELGLSLTGWPDAPWTNRAAELHGTEHRWRVHRVVRRTAGADDDTDIDEADVESVESSGQYCLLECTRADG